MRGPRLFGCSRAVFEGDRVDATAGDDAGEVAGVFGVRSITLVKDLTGLEHPRTGELVHPQQPAGLQFQFGVLADDIERHQLALHEDGGPLFDIQGLIDFYRSRVCVTA